MEKNVGKSCSTCGQVFDPSISFCPTDGTKLSGELVTASSHELIQVTSRNLQKKPDATRVSFPQIVLEIPATSKHDDAPNESFGNGSKRSDSDANMRSDGDSEKRSEADSKSNVSKASSSSKTTIEDNVKKFDSSHRNKFDFRFVERIR